MTQAIRRHVDSRLRDLALNWNDNEIQDISEPQMAIVN